MCHLISWPWPKLAQGLRCALSVSLRRERKLPCLSPPNFFFYMTPFLSPSPNLSSHPPIYHRLLWMGNLHQTSRAVLLLPQFGIILATKSQWHCRCKKPCLTLILSVSAIVVRSGSVRWMLKSIYLKCISYILGKIPCSCSEIFFSSSCRSICFSFGFA